MTFLARDIGCMEFAVFEARSPRWRLQGIKPGEEMPDAADFVIYVPDGFWTWAAEDMLDFVRDEIARELRNEDRMVFSLLAVAVLATGAVLCRWSPTFAQVLVAAALAIGIAWVGAIFVRMIRRSFPALPTQE